MPAVALIVVGVWFLAIRSGQGAPEAAVIAFLAAYGLTPVVRALASRGGALDHPDARKRHDVPIPKLGGVAVVSAFVLAIGRRGLGAGGGGAGPADPEMLAIALAALVLTVAGAFDDTRGLSARIRLALQLSCAVAVILAGVRLNLFPGHAGAALNMILSVVWIVGITNAYNFIDGIDGLAAALGALIAVLLGVVARAGGGGPAVEVSAALAGALLGFLPHNLRLKRRASIFLGDSGSASVGFLLAALAIKQDWAEGNPVVALAAPVLIFSVLIYDMVQTTVSRVVSGRVRSFRQWIDYVGRDHIHHRLADLLGTERRALLVILCLALGLGLSALGLRRGDDFEAAIFIVHGALVLLVVAILEAAAGRARARGG